MDSQPMGITAVHTTRDVTDETLLTWAREVLDTEIEGLAAVRAALDHRVTEAARMIDQCAGKVVFTGMGKAGIIAQKAAATFSSLGIPGAWMHLADAVHGDLGRVDARDVVVVLSYSGATDELTTVLPVIRLIGASIIAITGNAASPLADAADVVLDVAVPREACSLGMAPTTSTTAMLALCDALAVTVARARGVTSALFARFHPNGSLGRRMLLRARDCMRTGGCCPVVGLDATVADAILEATRTRNGACLVADETRRLRGIFTDGDLRRGLQREPELLRQPIRDWMTTHPIVIDETMMAVEALKLLKARQIDEAPVVDASERVLGLLDIQDLVARGIF
ncbi:MAG TPA: KpsF/GutQ family sugar-phosphate isomerase [Candidatus Hydrogenedentes bacterium]|nr:KpsF/GutQ family sugar-phosphate isomerase [Candidatus Hydrogenedentota bacterium]